MTFIVLIIFLCLTFQNNMPNEDPDIVHSVKKRKKKKKKKQVKGEERAADENKEIVPEVCENL